MTSAVTDRRIWMITRPSHESDALRAALLDRHVGVTSLPFPVSSPETPLAGQGLSGLAASLGAALREVVDGVDISGLEAQMRSALPAPDAVLFLEPDVAVRVGEPLRSLVGSTRQIAVETHLGMDDRWATLVSAVVSVRHDGGVLSGLGDRERRLDGEAEHVVIATDGLDVAGIDPLLLQLSIAELGSRPLLFLPSGRGSVDEHLKSRAAFYGLSGQRPNTGSDLDAWIRGARLMIGRPSERQLVAALSAGTATLLIGEFVTGSGFEWSITHDLVSHARAPVEVSVAVEESLGGAPPSPTPLEGVETAADAVIEVLQRAVRPFEESHSEGVEESLEPIGRAAPEPTMSPEHERLEIDDALAQLKRRMGLNDDEG